MYAFKQYYFIYLLVTSCLNAFVHQQTPTVVFTLAHSQAESSQTDIKHGIRATHISSHNSSEYAAYYRTYYASLSQQDFQQAFQHIPDINEILNKYPLYAFDNFLTFVRTLPGYETHILLLHDKLKIDKTFKKQTAYMPYFTYSFDFGYEKSGFHNFITIEAQRIVNNQKQKAVSIPKPTTYYAPPQDLDVLSDDEELSNLCRTYLPYLSYAFEKRINAFKSITTGDNALQYTNKSYSLNDNIKQLLNKYDQNITCFTQCYGHELHQALHQESLNLLDLIDTLSSNSILYDHQEALIDFTIAMTNYNHENKTDKAMRIGNLCWTLLDYSQAIAEGVILGISSATSDLLHHPFEASLNVIIGKQVLAYQLCKILYNFADISVTALINTTQAKNKWNKYTEPINNLIDLINEKKLSIHDAIKGCTALIVGYKTQSIFLGGLGKFCNTIQQKATRFAQNNISSFTVQQYLATPEGYLLRSVAKTSCDTSCPNQYDHLKQWLSIKEFTSVIKTTQHGINRLIERKFTPKDVENVMKFPSFIKKQKNGALAYVKQVGEKFNVIIFNEHTEEVVTALKNTNQKKLDLMGKNYGWQ